MQRYSSSQPKWYKIYLWKNQVRWAQVNTFEEEEEEEEEEGGGELELFFWSYDDNGNNPSNIAIAVHLGLEDLVLMYVLMYQRYIFLWVSGYVVS